MLDFRVVGKGLDFITGQHPFGQRGGVVLRCRRPRQMRVRGYPVLQPVDETLTAAVLVKQAEADDGVAQVGELLVESAMLLAVPGFLAYEPGYPLLQLRVGDVVRECPHAADE